jgi:PhnB protein
MVKKIPDGYHTITPALVVKNGNAAIDFYKRAFGAVEVMRMAGPDGTSLMHAELEIGGSKVMLSDEQPSSGCRAPASLGSTSATLYVYVPDADAAVKQAVNAGATVVMPVADMFWGDRAGQVADPSGHRWMLATHKEDVAPADLSRRAREFFAAMAQSRPKTS